MSRAPQAYWRRRRFGIRRSGYSAIVLALLSSARLSVAEGEQQNQGSPAVGIFEGQLRSYFMSTQNEVGMQNPVVADAGARLRDWHSWALGGRLGYHTPWYHGVGAGVSVYASREVVGNSEQLDSATGRPNRYEVGLYNVADTRDKEVTLIGEAYVDLKRGGHDFWAGRHLLSTPLFNPQDGRMIPTLAQGVWYGYQAPFGVNVQGGYIGHIAPRSTERFSRVRDSFGLYPMGRNDDGTASAYAGHVDSAGLLIASLGFRQSGVAINVWDYHTENVFNALYGEGFFDVDWAGLGWRLGGQYLLQQKVGNGGNSDPHKAYFQDDMAQAFGAQVRVQHAEGWSLAANYDRVTAQGRFLFPREWGREPLFVFQKRERVEGSGDLHAFLLEVGDQWAWPGGDKLVSKLGYGHYYLPPPNEPALNKYAMPTYRQVNLDVFYHGTGVLQGLVAELLIVYKGQLGERVTDPAFTFNKVDVMIWHLILNYGF